MLFDVSPSDIEKFDGVQTVELLRRLVYAEAKAAGVGLFNVAAPMQITVADGGMDAAVVWTGGHASTDYFPHRDIIFQCKASDGNNSAWQRETWTKPSRGKGKVRELNPALTAALTRGAAYIGVTTAGIVGAKPADRERAIADGIRMTGADPDLLATIRLYDGNTLAEWASRHQAVALWVKEHQAGMTLRAFATVERWRGREGADAPAYVPGQSARFEIGDTTGGGLTFDQFAARLVAQLSEPEARSVRVTGSSGVGKSRGVFEGLTRIGLGERPTASSVIFCDRREAGDTLWSVVSDLANRNTPVILFVDECPRDDALKLHTLASAAGSELRVISIDTDPKGLSQPGCLDIWVQATDEDVIDGILAQLLPGSQTGDRRFIADLCAGFPSIAVLAARAHDAEGIFRSVADVATRILRGAKLTDPDQVRALACLALFDSLAPEHSSAEFDAVATALGRLSGDAMYEHLVDALEPGLVGRYGRALAAQPRPIANHLALRRLERLRSSVVQSFLDQAPASQRTAMLSRVRYLSRSSTLREVAYLMFGQGGSLASAAQVLTWRGSDFVSSFVHVDPAYIGRTLHFAVSDTSLEDLALVKGDLDGVISALRRLAFRRPTFRYALHDLLRISAAEGEAGGPASEAVQELFHLRMSGTEAPSKSRFAVLDEFAEEDDPRVRRTVIAALDAALDRGGRFRIAGHEELGDLPNAVDWSHSTVGQAVEHFASALKRLAALRKYPDVVDAAEGAAAQHMRQLMIPELLEAVREFISEVKADRGFWAEAARGVGDWLYYDREDPTTDLAVEVRRIYDSLLPSDIVDRLLLYCQFWPADIRDPDKMYRSDQSAGDFEYAARQAAALAPAVASTPATLDRAIAQMAKVDVCSPSPFTDALAPHLANPRAVFAKALEISDAADGQGRSFIQSLIRSLDRTDPTLGPELEKLARQSRTFEGREIAIYMALRLSRERLVSIAQRIKSGAIAPEHAVPLSYGRSMDPFSAEAIRPVIHALIGRAADGGVWAAVEMMSMYTHGRTQFDSDVYALIREVLTTPLGVDYRGGVMSSHSYGALVSALFRANQIDDEFARGVTRQLIGYLRSTSASYGSPIGDAMQQALETLVKVAPVAVWTPLAEFYEVATPAERMRLTRVVSRRSNFGEAANAFRAGVLFAVPLDVLIGWAAEAPETRVGFLVSFFPTLGPLPHSTKWHPTLMALADAFGETKAFKAALIDRISPTSWGGSLAPFVEPYLEPLKDWQHHPELGDWAEEVREMLLRRLKTDAEMELSWP